MVKDANAQILRNGEEVRRRWAEYFEQVQNVTVADVRDQCSRQLADAGVGRFELKSNNIGGSCRGGSE